MYPRSFLDMYVSMLPNMYEIYGSFHGALFIKYMALCVYACRDIDAYMCVSMLPNMYEIHGFFHGSFHGALFIEYMALCVYACRDKDAYMCVT